MEAAVGDVVHAEKALAREFRRVGDRHVADADVHHLCHRLAMQCHRHVDALTKIAGIGDEETSLPAPDAGVPRRLLSKLAARSEKTGLQLLKDLRKLYLRAQECELAWSVLLQGARATREEALATVAGVCVLETTVQAHWIKTRLKEAAPQVLSG
jgi:hypothetical protein